MRVCARVCVPRPSCANLCTLYYLVFFKYPFEWALSRHATRFFSHALCTVPLHIFIYYPVFQDQNECQIGSGERQRGIAADVGVSRGWETGGLRLNGRDRSEQDGFGSCFVTDSTGHRMRKRSGIRSFLPSLSTASSSPTGGTSHRGLQTGLKNPCSGTVLVWTESSYHLGESMAKIQLLTPDAVSKQLQSVFNNKLTVE